MWSRKRKREEKQEKEEEKQEDPLVEIKEDADPKETASLFAAILKVNKDYNHPISQNDVNLVKVSSTKSSLKERLNMHLKPYIPPKGTLTVNQYRALICVLKGNNVFITGVAGSGKSYFLRYAYTILTSIYEMTVHITASTGTAVANLEISSATTLHSFIGRDRFEGSLEEELASVRKNPFLMKKFQSTTVLFIDEISLVDAKLLDKFDQLMKQVRGCSLPFGGIAVVAFGDFMQLPPVRCGENVTVEAFAFHAEVWKAAFRHVIYFNDNMRQRNSPEFFSILQEIREGRLSDDSFAKLQTRILPKAKADEFDVYNQPICIYPKKKLVEDENNRILKELMAEPGTSREVFTFRKKFKYFGLSEKEKPFHYRKLNNSVSLTEELTLCTDLPVILITNYSPILRNGAQGVIVGWDKTDPQKVLPIVEFTLSDNGKPFTHQVTVHNWIWDSPKNPMLPFRSIKDEHTDDEEVPEYAGLVAWGIPLAPGKAITIHRSQCKTFNKIYVNLHHKNVFSANMAYVALSRVETLEGLFIEDISKESLTVFPDIVEMYQEYEKLTEVELKKIKDAV